MIVLGKKVEDFDNDFVQSLLDNKVPESKTLDYKLTFDLSTVEKKVEFLKDITSFYNTEGGILIFGLQEEKDGKKKLGTPILPEVNAITLTDFEQTKSQILTCARSGTNPHIPRLVFSPLLDLQGRKVFAIGIPQNTSLPSMVTLNTTHTFHRRSNTDKYMPDTHELYQSFIRHNSLKYDIERYIQQRIDRFPGPFSEQLKELPCALVIILPLNFQDTENLEQLTTKEYLEKAEELFPAFGLNQFLQNGYSIEGLSLLQKNTDYIHRNQGIAQYRSGYTLLLRNGGIERANSTMLISEVEDTVYVYVDKLAEILNATIENAYSYYEYLEMNPQFFVSISLLNLKEKNVMISSINGGSLPFGNVKLPTLFFGDPGQKYKQLGLLFDLLWQASGVMECPQKFKSKFFVNVPKS